MLCFSDVILYHFLDLKHEILRRRRTKNDATGVQRTDMGFFGSKKTLLKVIEEGDSVIVTVDGIIIESLRKPSWSGVEWKIPVRPRRLTQGELEFGDEMF